MDENSEVEISPIENAVAQMEEAQMCADVTDRYFHQRQAELYLKVAELEIRIDANRIAVGHAQHVRDLAHQASIPSSMKGRVN